MFVIFAAITISICFYIHFRIGRKRLYELADKIGGLKPLPLIGNAHQFAGTTEHIMNTVRQVSYESMACIQNKYLYKVWLGHRLMFSVGDPKDAELVLKMCLEKDDIVKFIRALSGNGLIFAPVSIWKNRRKIVMPAFNRKILDTFVEVFYEQSETLVQLLKKSEGKGPIRMCRILNACTLDSVSETAMGVKLNSQCVAHSPYLEAVEQVFQVICTRIFHVWLHTSWIFKLTKFSDIQKKALDVIFTFTDKVVKEKRMQAEENPLEDLEGNTGVRKPFLELLIGLSGKEKAFTDLELREEVLTIIIAGTDTSALGIGYSLTTLGSYPDVQEKAYKEVMAVIGNGPITKEHLPKLTYLECVIKETLRLYPPVPLIIRQVTKELQLPSGPILPAGSGAVVNIHCIHRNRDEWGPDADVFRPERFLEEHNRHPCSYIPFSAGARNCLGYQYAMMSMKTVIANILRNYVISSEVISKMKLEIMLRPTAGINIAFNKRE